jgi:lactoylglutathione lyase
VEKMITHIHAITVLVTDQDRALDFYQNALGFVVTADNKMANGFRWITVAPQGAETNLILYKASPNQLDKVGVWTGMVLYTEDIEKTYSQLTAKGVVFSVEPQKLDWGGVEGQFKDLDGNSYELVERPRH